MRRSLIIALTIWSLCLPSGALAQLYGLDAPVAVGAFLDGVFPPSTPQGPASWTVEDAFPSVTGIPNTILVMESNPIDDRFYLGSRDGIIVSIPNDRTSTASAEPFMDLTDRLAVVYDGGLLGLAFHPDFGQPGSPNELHFFVYYSSYCPTDLSGTVVDFPACNPGYPQANLKGYFNTWLRLSRFTAYYDAVAGVYRGNAATEVPLINIRLYNNSHRGGGPSFGNDGRLYLAVGDQFRYQTAQDIEDSLEGGVLRLEVDVTDNLDGTWTCPAGSHQPRRLFRNVTGNLDEMSGHFYCIPDDNPWQDVLGGVMEEYFSIGHRNPHRLAIDPDTGRIWSGEIGENTREEINVVEIGGNYGWPFREGLIPGPEPPPVVVLGTLTDPVIDFDRIEANSIIGGYVYRGTEFPELYGRYLAGDWVTKNVWAFDLDPVTMTATKELLTSFTPGGLATFGIDNQGEVILGSVTPGVGIKRLAKTGVGVPDPPPFLSQLGAFTDLASLSLHAAAIPYEPLTFWSDGTEKGRWIFVPNDGTHDQPDEQISYAESGNWDFPVGTVIMKHFELPIDEANPSVTERVETRFLVRGTDLEWYGVNYRWLPNQLDARLLTTAETGDYTIQTLGGPVVRTWDFPSRGDCLTCHNVGVEGPIGPRTRGLNRDLHYPSTGRTDNQLRTWAHLGLFDAPPAEPSIPTLLSAAAPDDASASLEFRARSYLDTNCGYCHQPAAGNRAEFDARLITPLADQGLVWAGVIDPLGLVDPHLVTPGDPAASLIHHRASLVGVDAMPPLAKNVVDAEGVALLGEWIDRVDPNYPRQGLVYEYYEELGLLALPDFDTLTPVKTGAIGTFDLSLRERDDDFAFRFTGVVEIPTTGDWTFYTTSDEGSQLFVDDVLIVDNDGIHTSTEQSGTVTLTAGYHDLRVTMFEAIGAEVLAVDWEGPGVSKQSVAADKLFQVTPTPISNVPPVLTDPGAQGGEVGDPVSLALLATDADLDSLYYSATGLPAGVTLDSDTGAISGALGAGSFGTFDVTLGVSDGPSVDVVQLSWIVTDSVAPTVAITAPTGGATLVGSVSVQATASDLDGVAGVEFFADGVSIGPEDVSAPFEATWDTTAWADGTYSIEARARDAAGNVGLSSLVLVDVDNPVVGPVAAWGFGDSAGSTLSDTTERGHDGAITGALWTAEGRFGGALEFDGVDDVVVVPDADDLDLASGAMTLSAWVRPAALGSTWSPVLQKEADAYMLHASAAGNGAPTGGGTFAGVCCTLVDAGTAHLLPLDTWSYLAVTYDGVELAYYVDGVAVATAPATGAIENSAGPLRIGNNTYPGEAFEGRIDEVRIYERALSPAEIAADMGAPVLGPSPDTTPSWVVLTSPTAGSGVVGVVTVEAMANDDVVVAGVQFLLDGVPLGAEDTLAPYEIEWNTQVSGNGAHALSARVRDGAGNEATSPLVSVFVENPPDVKPPAVTITSPAPGATVSGLITIEAMATDDVGVLGVQFMLDGLPLGAEDVSPPYSFDLNTLSLADGPYSITAQARDGGPNFSMSASYVVTVDNTTLVPVASWAFAEGIGNVALDSTGNGHTGTINGAAWTAAGHTGFGLSFDGVDDEVLVVDTDVLDMNGNVFTLSAWVYPTNFSSWAAVVQKEPNAYMLHASSFMSSRAVGAATINGAPCCEQVFAPPGSVLPLNAWTHLAVVYDGSEMLLYRDGVEIASILAVGNVEKTTLPLRIGNNSFTGNGFEGVLDDVRVYDRALDAAAIVADMGTPVPPGVADTTAPTVAITSPGVGASVSGSVAIDVTASDDLAVTEVEFFVDGLLVATDLAAPYTHVWDTTALPAGPYVLGARARDAASNIGFAADVGVDVVPGLDVTPPSVSITSPGPAETRGGAITLVADATDAGGLVEVVFEVDGLPIAAPLTAPPWEVEFLSPLVADGSHTITATATDVAGNSATSPGVAIAIDNATLVPVAAWRFEEGAGAIAADATKGGHDGAVFGAAWDANGRRGGALLFDGIDDRVQAADHADLDFGTGSFSISAWVEPNGVLASQLATIVRKEGGAYLLSASSLATGAPVAEATLGGGCCTTAAGLVGDALTAGQWTHLAVTYDGVEMTLYAEGVAIAVTPATGGILDSALPLQIGNDGLGAEGFTGRLDEIRLYDRSLTAGEVNRDRDEVYVPEASLATGVAVGALLLSSMARWRARAGRIDRAC